MHLATVTPQWGHVGFEPANSQGGRKVGQGAVLAGGEDGVRAEAADVEERRLDGLLLALDSGWGPGAKTEDPSPTLC